ncbi:MAG: hypothetical protein ACKODR_00430, partial [Acidimicrobiaceae bacterium]
VSLGLDTFVTDPISDLALTTPGYDRCGALVGASWVCQRWCYKRVVMTLMRWVRTCSLGCTALPAQINSPRE